MIDLLRKFAHPAAVTVGSLVVVKTRDDAWIYGRVLRAPDRSGIFEAIGPSGPRRCHTGEVAGVVDEGEVSEAFGGLLERARTAEARVSELENRPEPEPEVITKERDPDPELRRRIGELENLLRRKIER